MRLVGGEILGRRWLFEMNVLFMGERKVEDA